jgi:hypothetical protein
MLMSFIEKGGELRDLSRSQLQVIESQFALYLVHGTTMHAAVQRCTEVLDDDQMDARSVIRKRLAEMIGDPECNTRYKPAIIRLAAGDDLGYKRMGVSPKRCRALIERNARAFRRAVRQVQHPIQIIGPKHLGSIEVQHLENVRSHAVRFVRSKARFLSMGEAGLETRDLVNDLLALALRSMRWYYPFRTGLHIENTMRKTITNRGRSLIKFNTADQRARLVQDEFGVTYNRESGSGFDAAIKSLAASHDPSHLHRLNSVLDRTIRGGGPTGRVAAFVKDQARQERFLDWVARTVPGTADVQDVAEAVQRFGLDYPMLLARYLHLQRREVQSALEMLRLQVA